VFMGVGWGGVGWGGVGWGGVGWGGGLTAIMFLGEVRTAYVRHSFMPPLLKRLSNGFVGTLSAILHSVLF
jgi:hypothetical protein